MCCGRSRESCSPRASYATRGSDRLPMPVDDPTAIQVVGRKLDLHPVSRQDPDAVAPHLPRGVTERFGDLALELDLLLLGRHSYEPTWTTLIASGPFAPSRCSNSTLAPSVRLLKPLPAMFEWWTKTSFAPSSGAMKP